MPMPLVFSRYKYEVKIVKWEMVKRQEWCSCLSVCALTAVKMITKGEIWKVSLSAHISNTILNRCYGYHGTNWNAI